MGASGARPGQGCPTSGVSWGDSYSSFMLGYLFPLLIVCLGGRGRRQCAQVSAHKTPYSLLLPGWIPTPSSLGLSAILPTESSLTQTISQSPQATYTLAYTLPWPLPTASWFSLSILQRLAQI